MSKVKKFLLLTFIAISLVLLGAYGVPWFTSKIKVWGNTELLTVITLGGVLVALAIPFIERKLAEHDKKEVYQIDINVDTSLRDNVVLFSASIKNIGPKKIILKTANLYFDEGIERTLPDDLYQTKSGSTASYYDFPFILEHKKNSEGGRPDCVICQKCFRGRDESYPKEVLTGEHGNGELLHTHKVLDHLSEKSIKYICPDESFTEDVLVKFPKHGAYRVTLFVGMDGEADCMCATKQFYIPRDINDTANTRNAVKNATRGNGKKVTP